MNNSALDNSPEELLKQWGPYILTLEQREQLISIIDNFLKEIFTDSSQINFDMFPAQFRLGLPNVEFPLKEYESAEVLHKYFEEVKSLLLNVPVIEITVAFSPSTAFLASLLDDIRLKRKGLCLLKYQCDPLILGGVIIKTEGIVSDYSLRRLIDII